MRQETPGARGERLIALLAWMKPYRQLGPDINRFQALVADDGDTLDRTITVVSVIAGGRDEGRDSLAPASRGSARAPDPARSGASTPGSTDVGSKMQPSPPTSPSSTTMGAPAASASPAVAAARFRASLAGEPSPAGERTACVLAGYRRTASTPFEPWLTDSPGRAAPLAPLLGPTGRARSAADTGGRAVRPRESQGFLGAAARGPARQLVAILLASPPNARVTEYQAPFCRSRSETRIAIRILE